jgi:ribokinase
MSAIVVTGYASLDYAFRLDRAPQADATATILSRPIEWPRLGGSPAYVTRALVAAGIANAKPVTWIGEDADGARYSAELAGHGIALDGIALRPGRTPVCILGYQPDGGCHCYYDPGLDKPLTLDSRQRELIAAAQWVCLTVGPAEATAQALAAARSEAQVVWAVKADPRAVPPDLAGAIAARADIIAWSRGEASFVDGALAIAPTGRPRLLVETRGRDGVALRLDGREEIIRVEPLAVEDATGAGDTFLGGMIAALIVDRQDLAGAVAAGARAAKAMLMARAEMKEARK